MDLYYGTLEFLRTFMVFTGSMIIFSGIAHATLQASRRDAPRLVARRIGEYAALGLEFFLGAGILNLIISPRSWVAVGATVLIIAVRRLLTFTLSRSARIPVPPDRAW